MNPVNKGLVLLLLSFIFTSVAQAKDEPSEGQIAPDFQITDLDGKQFKLSALRHKQPVYLVFWNTWCTYCMRKIPKLKDAHSNLSKDIRIIAINTSLKDSVEKSLKFQQKFAINYPLAFDHGKTVTDLYGVWGTPTEFIIDINGIIQHRDGVPDDLREHLAQWNVITEDVQIVESAAENCNQVRQTC